jgi:D-alanyl-lipoteichoic acid acyltransferase DltB (MBOAT superfamily)
VEQPRHDDPILRGAILLVLLLAIGVIADTRTASLLAWSDRTFPISRYPALLTCFFGTWLLLRTSESRRAALLFGSVGTGLVFDPGYLVLATVWIAVFHRILFGGARPRVGAALAFVLATYAGLALTACYDLFQDFLVAHSYLPRWAYVFAISLTFRLAWLLHEVRLRRERIAFVDVLIYLTFAPFFLILPYMLAIPRSDKFRADLDRHDPEIERSGLRMLAKGIALTLAAALVHYIYDVRAAFEHAAKAHDALGMLAHCLVYYPIAAVVDVTAISWILVGLVRTLGFDLAPAFDAPLLSRDVAEWWRRWNTHFRDLLVELFYYPALMRNRRRPERGIVIGCVMVFLVGSVMFHLPKYYLRRAYFDIPPIGLLVENLIMCAIVIAILIRRRRHPRPEVEPIGVRVRRMLTTWIVVMLVVVGAGYGSQALVQPEMAGTAWWSSEFLKK